MTGDTSTASNSAMKRNPAATANPAATRNPANPANPAFGRTRPVAGPTRCSPSCESGQAGGEVLAIGFILLIGLIFLGMNAWAVIDAKIRLSGASRYAVRTLVEADPGDIEAAAAAGESSMDTGPFTVVTDALNVSLADRPELLKGISVTVELSDGAFRCSRAIVTVKATVPSFGLPSVGPMRDGFGVVTRQSEIVDPFRSGLDGTGDCR